MLRSNSLRLQLLYRILAVVLVLLTAITFFQYFLLKNSLYTSAESLLQSRLHNIEIGELIETNTPESLQKKASNLINRMIDTNVSVIIIDKNGKIIADSESESRAGYASRLLQDENKNQNIITPKLSQEEYKNLLASDLIIEGTKTEVNSQGEKFLLQLTKLGSPVESSGLVQLSTSVKAIDTSLNEYILKSILLALFIFLLSVFLIKKVLDRTLKPLNNITDTLEEISVGKLSLRLPENNRQIEIDRLSIEFNEMLKRIEITFQNENEIKEKMKKFIADASHELKTPITSIHGFAEVLSMGAAKDEKQLKASLDTIMSESDRLTRLLNNLLLITRLDQGRELEMKPESLKQIIMEVYPQLQIMAGLKKLELNLQEDLIINANKDEIKQIIINLVQNAVKYTAKDGEIKISLKNVIKNREKYAEFIIEDNGMGIPQEKMDAVFDRFYRVEEHRARNQGGYGLGLSIVKEIVSRHGGEILVKSAVGKGAAFFMYFRA